ncbi:MAG TPA: GlsB/YeaQ/YmgE family stress response membrane protein [Burkholderiales bacterium]|nr:GlsB/YeaQ/YmgE family stress response membrane protein [Burkholderiales bacterium]
MEWLITIIIGGIIGWLASMIMKTNAQMGLILNIVIGVVGSFLGYWLAGLIGIAPEGGVLRFIIAVLGAVILILILKALGVFKRTA